jgi:hypothetical protein
VFCMNQAKLNLNMCIFYRVQWYLLLFIRIRLLLFSIYYFNTFYISKLMKTKRVFFINSHRNTKGNLR